MALRYINESSISGIILSRSQQNATVETIISIAKPNIEIVALQPNLLSGSLQSEPQGVSERQVTLHFLNVIYVKRNIILRPKIIINIKLEYGTKINWLSLIIISQKSQIQCIGFCINIPADIKNLHCIHNINIVSFY